VNRSPDPSGVSGAPSGASSSEVLWDDGERVLCREWRVQSDGGRASVLTVRPVAEQPAPAALSRLEHEFALAEKLAGAPAARPLELLHEQRRLVLVLEDDGDAPLAREPVPMALRRFLRTAIDVAHALGRLHAAGVVHKDITPANILINRESGAVRFTGLGIATFLARERQAPCPPESIAGTLAFMAPEQTGRMNRSVDSRSDLYSLGVTLYQLLTGVLPFSAQDPMDWVHSHIARTALPPNQRIATVPAVLSDIVMKLLAKAAEDRYQTAAALEHDLKQCLLRWEAHGAIEPFIEPFQLAEHDTPDRLLIPEQLYGRAREVETLLAAFDRVMSGGRPELMLVAGYSGIGKSAVIGELQKVLVPPRGLFAAGKFDQYKRDIPYWTLAQAFQGLLRPFLGKRDAELEDLRDRLREALGPNGLLIVNLVPELKLIIGEPPPIADLPLQDAQRRFQLVFKRFIGVFARAGHPLVLFLDDLQWLDSGTLDMLESLLVDPDLRHLLLIGAYRDNEADRNHPLMRKLDAIRRLHGSVGQIVLQPLSHSDLQQLVADALRCTPERAEPLARIVHEKTGGNPFFALQFLTALASERLLGFDHASATWVWDVDRIRAKGFTDNVVNLMIMKLARLPEATRTALQHLAAIGHSAGAETLALVFGKPGAQVHADLWEAVCEEYVLHQEGGYRFVHDRVQEAAYSLIPQPQRAQTHLRIGRLLAARTPRDTLEDAVFEIVNQLNRGAALIDERAELDRLAELNLMAGKRAQASAAYASALDYLKAGSEALADDRWQTQHALAFSLELHRAECEFLSGDQSGALARLLKLFPRVNGIGEHATLACLAMNLYVTLDRSDEAVTVGLDYLRRIGIEWSPHPSDEEARSEYAHLASRLGERSIESLIDLPLMSDPDSLATIGVLNVLTPAAIFSDGNLFSMVVCRAVNLSLEYGNCGTSPPVYVDFGMTAGPRFGDYQTGFRFARLGYELVEQRGLQQSQAKVYMNFGNLVTPWAHHVRTGRDLIRRAFEIAVKTGDLTFAGYSCNNLNANLLAAGDPLDDAQREAERGLAFAQKTHFGLVVDIIATQLALMRTLRGSTLKFGLLDDGQLNEAQFENRLSGDPSLAIAECWYWIRKMQARYFAGDFAAAVDASVKARALLWTSASFFETAEYHFYSALSHAALCDAASPDVRDEYVAAITAHHRQLEIWAANCPQNFSNRAALVGAELARLQGRMTDAEQFYEIAIGSSRENAFVHNEAVAYETASRFYAARGLAEFAHLYLKNARYAYLRWGANGKVRQLDDFHPQLATPDPRPRAAGTIETPVEHLDLATVIKVSQAVSSEIVPDNLIHTIMRSAIAHAGAERGLLIVPTDSAPCIVAQASTNGDTVSVSLGKTALSPGLLPESVVHYAMRAKECVILDDASTQHDFSGDPYIARTGVHAPVRSIACMPLVNQRKLIAVLYLENNLAPDVFTASRIAVLKLLASQAAISLENARLYRELAEREARIRRLVDANIVGVFIWDFEGRIHEANDAFLRLVGYDRTDLALGRLRWTELTPPSGRERDARAVADIRTHSSVPPYEKEFLRADGSRVAVLLGAATFGEARDQGVAFIVDLTDRKRAESDARENERRYREMEVELAHANRVATMGQLTASITHEIRQPIAAAMTNAHAALRWLNARTPDLNEVREALERIVNDGSRANDVIGRIRALVKKAPARTERIEINDAIREVIALTRGEAVKHRVAVEALLSDALPYIHGDRVQLQQVMLNLIINAIEAMSGAGAGDGPRELLIATSAERTQATRVAVSDTGPGVDADAIGQLFEPFYTTKAGGMGMGLSICRSIVEAHGGTLSVEARSPRGATFVFVLPGADEDALPENDDYLAEP
jgi:PAS domain S-box-containing protein